MHLHGGPCIGTSALGKPKELGQKSKLPKGRGLKSTQIIQKKFVWGPMYLNFFEVFWKFIFENVFENFFWKFLWKFFLKFFWKFFLKIFFENFFENFFLKIFCWKFFWNFFWNFFLIFCIFGFFVFLCFLYFLVFTGPALGSGSCARAPLAYGSPVR